MNTEYQLTPEEFSEIKEIASRREPVMKIGNTWTGDGPQEAANEFWKRMGHKYGFVWDSAKPEPGKSADYFTATPTQNDHN